MKLLTEADVIAIIDSASIPIANRDILKQYIRALPAADQWQGIENAKKDPLWIIGTDGNQVAPMIWQVECDDDDYTGWCGGDPLLGGIIDCEHVPLGFEPTLFQPLPPPPIGAR